MANYQYTSQEIAGFSTADIRESLPFHLMTSELVFVIIVLLLCASISVVVFGSHKINKSTSDDKSKTLGRTMVLVGKILIVALIAIFIYLFMKGAQFPFISRGIQ